MPSQLIEMTVMQAEILEAPAMSAEIVGLNVSWPEMMWSDVVADMMLIGEMNVLIPHLENQILIDLSFVFSVNA